MKYYVYILTDSTLQGHVSVLLYFVILIRILLCGMCPWLTRKVFLLGTLGKCHLTVDLQRGMYNSPGDWTHWAPVGDTANENLLEEISYTVTDDYKIYLSFCLWFHS